MLFNSADFLVFFPIVTLIFFIIPHRVRYLWLLVSSYYFYMCWNAVYSLLLFASTFITWASGLAIAAYQRRGGDTSRLKSQGIVAISFTLNLLLLMVFKYTGFIVDNLNQLVGRAGASFTLPRFSLLLPVGISFYIFQALSYTVDVYRGDVQVERNLLRYAVFVAFFPQLVAGPIERSSRLLEQFYARQRFDYERMARGLMVMFWGYFQKMVVADRLAVIVSRVFDYYASCSGLEVLVACVFFAFQIYCDFAGYSCIAIGAAQVMGFELMENFKQPYLGICIADFWRRWHISLTSWFRDYLYIPLGGNRKGRLTKYRNIMIVFLASGLWHGANWTYVIWGGLNGLFQIVGEYLRPLRQRLKALFRIDEGAASSRIAATAVTFLLVDLTWIFFRADTLPDAIGILRRLFTGGYLSSFFSGGLYSLGLSQLDFWLGVLFIFVLLTVDVLHERNVRIRSWILGQALWFRWAVYLAAIFTILLFGFYGPNYDAAQFIYFQF
ncbi:MAG: MBOAT family protein [Christensenellaceae bacterium]|nr:MBOAT family protein [Christensenellaceae bacterium]